MLNFLLKVLAAIQINGVNRFTVCIFISLSFFTLFKYVEDLVGLLGVDLVFEIADRVCFKFDVSNEAVTIFKSLFISQCPEAFLVSLTGSRYKPTCQIEIIAIKI